MTAEDLDATAGEDLHARAAEDPASLELDADEMRAAAADVVERVVAHIAALGDQPACGDLDVAALCRELAAPAPERGRPIAEVLEPYLDRWVHASFNTAGPGYFAYIPGGGLYAAALADLIADTTNRFTGVWQAAPALVQLEANVLDWFREWMTFPPGTRGLLTTGGSMANFIATVCARERALGAEIRPGVVYTSDQVHHSVLKAARMAGIAADRVRAIPVDDAFRMRVDALDRAIVEDRERGLHPFLVVSSAGTTNTGAVDPLDAVADVCAQHGVWHHCDGAYGAFFHMVPDLRPLLAGLERADSLTLDPHKGLFLPYGTGALLVRDGSALRDVFGGTASYLPAAPDAEVFYDPAQHGPELSRDFRGLRVWLPLQLHGAARFRAAVAEKRALAVEAAERIAALPGVVMRAPPQLSLFAWNVEPPGASPEEADAATRAMLDRVNARGRVMITGCTAGGRFLARVCVLSFRSRRAHVDACVEDVATAVATAVAEVVGDAPRRSGASGGSTGS